ncbi:MAG: hypothetical protein II694_00960 [Lachnospiraceae bacterium]|nr:hypothetical protein [Lachnospiraceae bacterium]
MERYRNFIRLEQMKENIRAGRNEEALKLADCLSPSAVRSNSDLTIMSDLYLESGMLAKAGECLDELYSRKKTRSILMQLINLSVRLKKVEEAEKYYREFKAMAPDDFYNYIFRYSIDKIKGRNYDTLIEHLEKLKATEYIDSWAYELAKLYHKAGRKDDCIRECDDIVIWFGDGEYVDRAKALKAYYLGELSGVMHAGKAERNGEQAGTEAETAAAQDADDSGIVEIIGSVEEAAASLTGDESDDDMVVVPGESADETAETPGTVGEDNGTEGYTESGEYTGAETVRDDGYAEPAAAEPAAAEAGAAGRDDAERETEEESDFAEELRDFEQDTDDIKIADEVFAQIEGYEGGYIEVEPVDVSGVFNDEDFGDNGSTAANAPAADMSRAEYESAPDDVIEEDMELEEDEEEPVTAEDVESEAAEDGEPVAETYEAEPEDDAENGNGAVNEAESYAESEPETGAESYEESEAEPGAESYEESETETGAEAEDDRIADVVLNAEASGEESGTETEAEAETEEEPEAAISEAEEPEPELMQHTFKGLGGAKIAADSLLAAFLDKKGMQLEDYFGFFAYQRDIRGQLIKTLEILLNPQIKNKCLIVSGEHNSGSKTIIKGITKILYQNGFLKNPQVAFSEAEKINTMSLEDKMERLLGCCLLINNAGKLSADAVARLLKANERFAGRTAVIITDYRSELNRLLKDHREINSMFPQRVHIPSYDMEDMEDLLFVRLAENSCNVEKHAYQLIMKKLKSIVREVHEGSLAEADRFIGGVIDNMETRNAKKLLAGGFEQVKSNDRTVIAADVTE